MEEVERKEFHKSLRGTNINTGNTRCNALLHLLCCDPHSAVLGRKLISALGGEAGRELASGADNPRKLLGTGVKVAKSVSKSKHDCYLQRGQTDIQAITQMTLQSTEFQDIQMEYGKEISFFLDIS